MAKQKISKIKCVAKEIGRFIITIPGYVVVMMLSAKLGCGHVFGNSYQSCGGNTDGGNQVFCVATYRLSATFCNTRLAILTGTVIVAAILELLAWKRKISKAWVVDFVILMMITFIAGAVVDYATRTPF